MGAYLVTKVLGFIFRMQFVRIAGEEAVGVYMAVYPAFIFFLAAIQVCCAALAMVPIRAIATLARTNIQGLARMSEGEAAIY